MTKWNDIPFHEDDTPEQKAANFDNQFAENAAAAEEKRANHQYPYDLDTPDRRK